jgi:hypothetical protein
MLEGFYKKEDFKLCIQGIYMEYMIYLENLGLTTFSTLMENAYWTNNFNIISRRNDFTPTIITQFLTIYFSKYFQDIKKLEKYVYDVFASFSTFFQKNSKFCFQRVQLLKRTFQNH